MAKIKDREPEVTPITFLEMHLATEEPTKSLPACHHLLVMEEYQIYVLLDKIQGMRMHIVTSIYIYLPRPLLFCLANSKQAPRAIMNRIGVTTSVPYSTRLLLTAG
jgi:hypothetical protein